MRDIALFALTIERSVDMNTHAHKIKYQICMIVKEKLMESIFMAQL